MEKKHDEITVKDLLHIFMPKLWLIILVAVVLAVAFGSYAAFVKKDTYTSHTMMYVYKSADAATTGDITVAQEMVEVYELIIHTDEVLNMILAKMPSEYVDRGLTASQLRGALSVSALGTGGTFKVSVTTGDPALSLAIAESAERVIPAEIIGRIPNAFLLTIIESPGYGAKNDKGITKNLLIGFLVGAAVSALAVFAFSMFDVVIHEKKKIEDSFNIPILGSIPHCDSEKVKVETV